MNLIESVSESFLPTLSQLNNRQVVKELLIPIPVRVLRGRLSICNYSSFPFDFKDGMWDLIVVVAEYCLSFYFNSVLMLRFIFCL